MSSGAAPRCLDCTLNSQISAPFQAMVLKVERTLTKRAEQTARSTVQCLQWVASYYSHHVTTYCCFRAIRSRLTQTLNSFLFFFALCTYDIGSCDMRVCSCFPRLYCSVKQESAVSAIGGISCSFLWFVAKGGSLIFGKVLLLQHSKRWPTPYFSSLISSF